MSVSLKQISKSFVTAHGTIRSVRNVTVEVEQGEFFCLLGPSGCGKTTTIRCIAGLENPDDGEIKLGGELVFSRAKKQATPVYQRNIGMVFQSYAIWPHMNVFDNIAFPLKYGMYKRPSEHEIQQKVANICALVQLEGLESRPSTQLRGRQQQRVALARALIKEPEVVLMDEPLSNLDAKLRMETRLELRQLLKKLGTTAVYVTHDQAEAFAVSDRIGVMLDGRLVQIGTPRDIYLRPSEAFIADFVGRINFLDGEVITLEGRDGRKAARTPIGLVECPGVEKLTNGQKIKMGIRSETIRILESQKGNIVNVFPGAIKSAVFLGEHIDCEVIIESQVFYVKVPPDLEVTVGSQVNVLLPYNSWVVLP